MFLEGKGVMGVDFYKLVEGLLFLRGVRSPDLFVELCSPSKSQSGVL